MQLQKQSLPLAHQHPGVAWEATGLDTRCVTCQPTSISATLALGRQDEGNHVVQSLTISRQHIGTGDPGILFKRQVHGEIAVINDSFSGDRLRGNGHNVIGFSQMPIELGPEAYRQRVLPTASRGSQGDPVQQPLLLLRTQRQIITKSAVVRIGLPGRHALSQEHFLHHVGPSFELLVTCKREGGDATVGVTAHTFFLNQGCNLRAVIDWLLLMLFPCTKVNLTSGSTRLRCVRFFSRKMRLEGLDQVVTRCLGFFTFVAKSIIHRPSKHHPQSFCIDDDGLCSPFDSKAACHLLGVIIQDRQGDFKIFSLTLQVLISILGIGVEQPEGDPLGGIGRSHSVELLIALAH